MFGISGVEKFDDSEWGHRWANLTSSIHDLLPEQRVDPVSSLRICGDVFALPSTSVAVGAYSLNKSAPRTRQLGYCVLSNWASGNYVFAI